VTDPVEPERELVRRLLPLALPALAVAVGAGAAFGGAGAAVSAGLGVVAVAANLVAHARSAAWASRISATAVVVVELGGYVLRIATFTAALFLLDRLTWFSPIAFVAAFVPATVALLVLELRYLAGRRTQADLWYFREASR
jgi:drug/metabolite transporter (DMT)-like permease